MNALVLFGLVLVNAAISAWNAYASGAHFTESKLIGGWSRVMTWAGLVMSACGFTWCYLVVATLGAVGFGYLAPDQGQALFELGYLIILLPILGSGFAIWADSLVRAYRTRSFGNMAVAGWNTYAQFSNTWNAARHAPSAFTHVKEVLMPKKRDSKDAGGALILFLVIIVLIAGVLTTAAIARWADRRVAVQLTA